MLTGLMTDMLYDDDGDIYKGNSSFHNPLFSVQECSLGSERKKNVFVVLTKPTSLNRFRSQFYSLNTFDIL